MKELLLDAETLYTREQLHDVLAKVCGFPADYGRNLDALYDLLTAYPAARLTLRHPGDAGRASRQLRRAGAPRAGGRGRRKSGVYAECTVTGKTKTEASASVFFLFRLACKPAPAWQDFVQKSEPLAPPQRTARKRAYNRKRRSMPPLFIKSRDMCVGFYTSKDSVCPQSGRAESRPRHVRAIARHVLLDHERGRDRS